MNFKETLEKLNSSDKFRQFSEENKNAFLCSAFFIIDYEQKKNTQQLDFFVPEKNKMAVFMVGDEVDYKMDDIFDERRNEIKELDRDVKVDISGFERIVNKDNRIKKIFAVLHHHEEKQIWNLTCILESFNMVNIHLDCETGEILKEEKRSLFDFANFVKGNRKEDESKKAEDKKS